MTTFDITTEGFDEIERSYGSGRVKVLGALNRTLRRVGQVVTPALKDNTPRVRGKLANSTRFQIKGTGEDQSLEIRQGARNSEGVMYRPFVTGGTGPHEIVPRRAKALRFIVNGRPVFAKRVRHPGSRSNAYHVRTVTEQMPAIREILADEAISLTVSLSD